MKVPPVQSHTAATNCVIGAALGVTPTGWEVYILSILPLLQQTYCRSDLEDEREHFTIEIQSAGLN